MGALVQTAVQRGYRRLKMAAEQDIIDKYKRKIAGELSGEADFSRSYSKEYLDFRRDQLPQSHTFYETACRVADKILPVTPAQKDLLEVSKHLKLAHLEINPNSVFSFAYLTTIIVAVLTIIASVLFVNYLILFVGLITSVALLFYLPKLPKRILVVWRSQASDELVLAVLYLTIYMQYTPNLERAVAFVAKHISPPLSIDFMKLLWDVETKTYTSITEAMNDYALTWKDWDPQFVDSLRLIESSLYEGSPRRKKEILDQALQVILEGTQDRLLNYAHMLKSPLESLHMLGVVLPVMGLVILPMAAAFMGASIKWYYILLLYNVLLPIIVYFIGTEVLATRPAGAKTTDVYQYLRQRYGEPSVVIFDKKIPIPAEAFGLITFLAIASPALYYFYTLAVFSANLSDELFSQIAVYAGIDLIGAIGLGFGIYYYLSVSQMAKAKKRISEIETTFMDSAFQLGERLEEHIPVEIAFEKIAESEKSEVANFYKKVVNNIRNLGTNLRDAIFNPRYGAINDYPSTIITSTMQVVVEGSKRSPEIAGNSLITISQYLRAVHRVSERMQDLLAETTSSMQMQVKIFVPVISGIVVGLAVLTISILRSLGQQLGGLEAGTAGDAAIGTGLVDIFQIQDMMSPFAFQLIVGIYVLQIGFILSVLLSGITYGKDTIEENLEKGINLILGTIIYVIVASVTIFLFNQLASPITMIVS